MTTHPRPDLAALVSARICHDLISPLGAIGNGVELMALSGAEKSPEMALIAQSVEHANARMRFFRISFGPAAPDQAIGRAEVAAILAAVAGGGRLQHDWTSRDTISRRQVRIAFLIVQCCETAMPHGGRIMVSETDEVWTINAEGPRLRIDSDLWATLSDPAAKVGFTAAQVHFALLPGALADDGRSIASRIEGDRIVLQF